jgi:hypothetical protein
MGFVKLNPKPESIDRSEVYSIQYYLHNEDTVSAYISKVFLDLNIPRRSSPYRDSAYCLIAYHHFHPEILKLHASNQKEDAKRYFPKTITSQLTSLTAMTEEKKLLHKSGFQAVFEHSKVAKTILFQKQLPINDLSIVEIRKTQ